MERRAPGRAGEGRGHSGRQVLGGRDRGGDHRWEHAVPGVQHRPCAVPAFQKQGGLVNLSKTFDDAESFITSRSGDAADGFRSPDGDLYQVPWKANPFMLYYSKEAFAKAGLDPEKPSLSTYDDVLAAASAIKTSGAADFALYPPASSDYTNSLFDFYPLYLANTGGTQLVKDGSATFTSPEGLETLEFWKTLYSEGFSSPEAYSGDAWAGPFADGVAAMGIAGPWGAAQFDGKVDYGVVPLRPPTASRRTRPTRSVTPRTSGSTARARTSRPPGSS